MASVWSRSPCEQERAWGLMERWGSLGSLLAVATAPAPSRTGQEEKAWQAPEQLCFLPQVSERGLLSSHHV